MTDIAIRAIATKCSYQRLFHNDSINTTAPTPEGMGEMKLPATVLAKVGNHHKPEIMSARQSRNERVNAVDDNHRVEW